jgi:hypothetical protein
MAAEGRSPVLVTLRDPEFATRLVAMEAAQ